MVCYCRNSPQGEGGKGFPVKCNKYSRVEETYLYRMYSPGIAIPSLQPGSICWHSCRRVSEWGAAHPCTTHLVQPNKSLGRRKVSRNLQVYSVCVNTSVSEVLSDSEEAPWLQEFPGSETMLGLYTSLTPILLHTLLLPPHLLSKAHGSGSCQADHLHLAKWWSTPLKGETAEFGSFWFVLWTVSRINVPGILWGITDLLPHFLWNNCLNCLEFFCSKITTI